MCRDQVEAAMTTVDNGDRRIQRECRRHLILKAGEPCVLCHWMGDEHAHVGLDHKGVMRACIQEVHFCWGIEDNFARERGKIGAGQC